MMDTEKQHFNWDDIDVGNNAFNHSQHFFAETHPNHEKDNNQNAVRESPQKQAYINILKEKLDNAVITDTDENLENEKNNQPCGKNRTECNNSPMKEANSPITCQQSFVNIETNVLKHSPLKAIATPTTAGENMENEQNNQEFRNNFDNSYSTQSATSSISSKSGTTKLPYLQTVEWSQKKTIFKSGGAITKSTLKGPSTPNAYKVKEIYKKKREAYERQRLEEERKQREFHAKPMPDLNAFIHKIQNRPVVHYVTFPVTPEVLKRSLKGEEKNKKKVENTSDSKELIKFSAQPATVLHEKSRVCEKKPLFIEQKPFKLHLLERLEKRKQYDEAILKALDDKRKQEEEERKRQEAECIRELRKATIFKARPNPFKK